VDFGSLVRFDVIEKKETAVKKSGQTEKKRKRARVQRQKERKSIYIIKNTNRRVKKNRNLKKNKGGKRKRDENATLYSRRQAAELDIVISISRGDKKREGRDIACSTPYNRSTRIQTPTKAEPNSEGRVRKKKKKRRRKHYTDVHKRVRDK
jgi:hypothetical protein